MTNDQKMKDIERQIADDFNSFNAEVYQGIIPKGTLDKYKKAVMATPPNVQKTLTANIKKIVAKKESALTNLDVAHIVNLVSATAPEKMYADINEALKGMQQFDDLRLDYNMKVKQKEHDLSERKATLVNLSGINIGNKTKIFQA